VKEPLLVPAELLPLTDERRAHLRDQYQFRVRDEARRKRAAAIKKARVLGYTVEQIADCHDTSVQTARVILRGE